MDSSIGKRLKQARESRNLKQAQVCEDLAIANVQSLSAYENGKSSISADRLAEFSRYYEVSADWILFGEELVGNRLKEKTLKDCCKQLVELIDCMGGKPEEYCDSFTHDSGQRIVMTGSLSRCANDHEFSTFLSKWIRLRTMLDDETLTEDEYQTLIDSRLEALPDTQIILKSLNEPINDWPF